MKYYQLVKNAKEKNIWNEKTIWLSVQCISTFIDEIKEYNIDLYWNFMREQTGILNNYHYDKCWAEYEIEHSEYTDKQGAKHSGAYWSLEQAEEAMKKMQLPADVNKYDFWVAINLSYSDLCKVLDEEQILKAACAFWFKDEDWSNGNKSTTKVWDYMRCKYDSK